jgi:serine/threonine-protein kinase
LGHGISGGVFLAEMATGRVAIRQFQSSAEPSGADWLAQRDHFLQGARQASSLVHPRIVTVLDVIDEDPEAYVATEYVSGETLANALTRDSFTPERANYLLRNVAVALDYAHQNGVTHGDVKPSDIFVSPQGGAKIGDFAISPRAWRGRPPEFSQGWIHSYLAPEVITSPQTIGPWSDRYSLAAVAYHLHTGAPLFAGMQPDEGPAIARGVIPAPSNTKRHISASTDAVLLRALSRDPQQRYRSCLEFVDALDASLAPQEPAAAVAIPIHTRAVNNKLLFGLGALGLVAAGAVAAALWSSHTKPLPAEIKSAQGKTAEPPRMEQHQAVQPAANVPLARQAPPGEVLLATRRQEPMVVNTLPANPSGKPSPIPAQPRAPLAKAEFSSQSPRTPAYSPPISRPAIPAPPVNDSPPATFQTALGQGGKPGDPRGMDLRIFSRGNEIGAGGSFSMKDPRLGELADGDLRAAISASGPVPKGRLSVEWWLDKVRMNLKMVAPQQLGARGGAVVDYGNEPTPGEYRVILRNETTVLKDFTFRITP